MRIKLIITALCLWICGYVFAEDGAVCIRGIEIYGNAKAGKPQPDCFEAAEGVKVCGGVTTKPEILAMYFHFKVGDTLDLEALRRTRSDLLRTQLYTKVDIFPHTREDGAHVFVVLHEAVRLQLGYGATYYTRKYGEDRLWYFLNADARLFNFRGRMEELSFGGSLWEYLAFDLGWTKPFLSTPYYISVGSGIAAYPDEALPVDYVDVFAKTTAGMRLSGNTRVSLSAVPIYRHRSVVESKLGEHNYLDFPERDVFYEAFGMVNLINDFRPSWFDPKRGWYMNTELRTNMPYPGVNITYFQFRNELRWYVPLLFDDVAAMRFALTLRDTDAGAYHRLSHGSTGTLRGYYEQALGWKFVANSSVLMSFKYHKPLFETQPLPLPIFNLIYRDIRETVYRLDATLIADYARLYEKPLGALTFDGPRQSGIGLGFGARLMVPDIRQSGCVDLVFGRRDKDGGGFEWKPMLHIYLDLFY